MKALVKKGLCVCMGIMGVNSVVYAWNPIKTIEDAVTSVGDLGNQFTKEVQSCFSGGCDLVVIAGKERDRQLERASKKLVGPAKDAAIEVINHTFDVHVKKLVENVDGVISKRTTQFTTEIDGVITKAFGQTERVLDRVTEQAKDLVSYSTDQIKDKLIASVSKEMKDIQSDLFSQINLILDRVSKEIDRVDCAVEGFASSFRNDLVRRMGSQYFMNPFDSCRQELNLRFRMGSSLENSELFSLTACQIERRLNKNSSFEKILGAYSDIQHFASQMRCVERMSNAGPDFYTEKYLHYGHKYNYWKRLRDQNL